MSADDKLDAITEELIALRAELQTLRAELQPKSPLPEKIDLTREEAMAILGFEPHQRGAFYQYAWKIGLKPYRQKHYRRCDVTERMARAAFKREHTKRRAA